MSPSKRFLFVGVGCFALLAAWAVANAAPPPTGENSAATTTDAKTATAGESIEQLVERLDSAEFKQREAACEKLAGKGKAAIPALEKAAAEGNLEVSSRAAMILGKLLKSADEATAKAATDALQHLADGDSPAAARKAKSILDNRNGLKNSPPNMGPPNGFGQIIINGGQLVIGGGAARTMSVKNVNGVKEIEANEDGKTVKIHDDPAKGVKVECTEKKDGKEVTKKYDAKSVDDLKKNHPAGYELYKKYGGGQAGNGATFRIQAALGNALVPALAPPVLPFGPALPVQPALPAIPALPAMPALPGPAAGTAPMAPATVPSAAPGRVEMATSLARRLSAELKRLQTAQAYKNASPASKAGLKKQIDELSKQLEAVRGQLGDQ